MIGLDVLSTTAGLLPAAIAIDHAVSRTDSARWRSATFWGLFALTMTAGPWLPDAVNGVAVLAMVALATAGLRPQPVHTTSHEEREASAARLGHRLFLPAMCLPAATLAIAFLMPTGRLAGYQLVDPKQLTLFALAIGALAALVLAVSLTHTPLRTITPETRRLGDAIGWAILLPQMLSALGGIFAVAGVGTVVSNLVARYVTVDSALTATTLYCVGMAVFTIVMGNAFAAFPVMTAGIGLPLVIVHFGGNPAIVTALGMLSGFCGTLMTPMAANFNIVPAAILELPDRFAVIKVQLPTALILLVINIGLMRTFAFS